MARHAAWLAGLVALTLGATLSPAPAQILRLNLSEMSARADGALLGEIVGRRVFEVRGAAHGEALFFTSLSLRGRALEDGEQLELELLYPGGFVDAERGVHNSEAPSADDTRLGNRVLVFHKQLADLGSGVAGRALYAMHGGLYRVAEHGGERVVLGRGPGYAVASNLRERDLESSWRALREER